MSTSKQANSHRETLIICDYGSQYTFLIAKKFRRLGVYTKIISSSCEELPEDLTVRAIVLSGSPLGLGKEESKQNFPSWVLASEKPVLALCYGMQLMVTAFGGSVSAQSQGEYGEHCYLPQKDSRNHLLKALPALQKQQTVWMSHADSVSSLPSEFEVLGKSGNNIAAIAHKSLPLLALQFHPEVHHSPLGEEILEQFLEFSQCRKDWSMTSVLGKLRSDISEEVGSEHVLIAVSGGVDSTVTAVLMCKALGREKVHCVLVDHGFMRQDEVAQVLAFLGEADVSLEVLTCQKVFLDKIKGISDPEEKRKVIGKTFIEVFEDYASKHSFIKYLVQGTLYSDVIESAKEGHGAEVIKSHHNVGGLPDRLKLKLFEPLKELFKDEVRQLGRELALSSQVLDRHPFPGPGLAIRIPGEVSEEKLDILRKADTIFIKALKEEKLYAKVWQAGVILLPVKSVGVMGDRRTYQWSCVLRAVTASDAMTAKVAALPHDFLTKTASQIVENVAGINRVLFDITTKPPATIEWE